MSATKNVDSIQPGEQFSSRPDRRETVDAPNHQPGTHNSAKDSLPTSTLKVVPKGTAPPSKTYQPNPPSDEAPRTADYNNKPEDNDDDAPRASAADTLGGATSADVNTGLGKPMQGQTSNEVRHDGQKSGSKQPGGLAGVGASGAEVTGVKGVVDGSDPDFAGQRALGKDGVQVGRGGQPGAEERVPASAGEVASERK